MKYSDLKLLSDEDIKSLVPKARKAKKLMKINLSKMSMNHAIFPRLAEIVPQKGDFGIFESTGTIVEFTGKLDKTEINLSRMSIPKFIDIG